MPRPMTDRPDQILARAQVPSANGRPVRKDEIELHDRGIYIESWLPERRSRRKPLLFVHGELAGSWLWERYLGYFAGRGWEGHALNLQNHHWSRTADPASSRSTPTSRTSSPPSTGSGPTTVVVGHGMGGLLALKAAERTPIAGLVLLSPELPRDLRPPARSYELARRAGRLRQLGHRLGDAAREAPARPARPDARRRRSGSSTCSARSRTRAAAPGARCCRACRSTRAPVAGIPKLVIGAALDRAGAGRVVGAAGGVAGRRRSSRSGRTRTTGWSIGEQSYQQVAESIRGFLEANRL